jgi:hypothetical protein
MTTTPDDEDFELDDVDLDALRRCITLLMKDPMRAEQLRAMLEDQSWACTASFASYVVQGDRLGLRPWEDPPCVASTDDPAGRLLSRLLAVGLSQFEPNLPHALEQAEARAKRRAKVG